MALHSLQHLIHRLDHQETFKAHQRFQTLLTLWPSVVGEVVASKTQPLGIQQERLNVAVCNAVWAQNLTYERQRILDKLKARSPALVLTDIRFSTTQWHSGGRKPDALSSDSAKDDEEMLEVWRSHPSRIPPRCIPPQRINGRINSGQKTLKQASHPSTPQAPEAAFQHWADTIQRRSHHLPLCPRCQCPTPEGELRRWKMCSLCAASHWATFPPLQ